jgi:hypothetical protein
MLMSAAVRYDKVDEETDKYLLESELRRWLTVLNYGAEPSDMDVDDVRSPPPPAAFLPALEKGGCAPHTTMTIQSQAPRGSTRP